MSRPPVAVITQWVGTPARSQAVAIRRQPRQKASGTAPLDHCGDLRDQVISGTPSYDPSTMAVLPKHAESYERYLVPSIFAPWAHDLIEAAALLRGERVLEVHKSLSPTAAVKRPVPPVRLLCWPCWMEMTGSRVVSMKRAATHWQDGSPTM